MKCIRYVKSIDKTVERVNDQVAESLVNRGEAVYVQKAAWKKETRDQQKISAAAKKEEKKETSTGSKKRSRRNDFKQRGLRQPKVSAKK